jgi:hypothetical protein
MGMWSSVTPVTDMVANTEAEVLAYALSDDDNTVEPESLLNYHHDAGADEDPEAIEGWDGEALSDAEQFETAINGFPDGNFDRPLQLAESERYESELEAMRQQNEAMQQQLAELQQRADPGRQQRQAQQREELIYQMIADPERAVQHMAGLHAQNEAMVASRVNASLGAAHRDHGRDFEAAYQNLTSLDPNNQAARNLVQSIYSSDDPGKTLMEWHEMTGGQAPPRAVGGGHSRGIMPSLNSGTPASYRGERSASRGRSDGWPVGNDESGYADDTTERDIMESAFR